MGRGSSPRQIAKRYAQQQRTRKRLVVGTMVVLGLGLVGAVMGDAYLQASRVLEHVHQSGESLKQVRSNLIRGKLPPESAFVGAAKEINEAQQAVDEARPTWRVARIVPFLGMPVSATEHLLTASKHELAAALSAKNLLEAILGQTLEDARREAEEAAKAREAADPDGDGTLTKEERRKIRQEGGDVPGSDEAEPEQDDPNALLSNGTVNLARVRELTPGVQELEASLAAAEKEVQAIGTVPFVSRANELRDDLIGEIAETRRLAARALSGLQFLPRFLGNQEKRNYLLLFQDSGYLRGSGGAYFAYAEIEVSKGKLSLANQGPIIDLDRYRDEPVNVPEGNWYLDTFRLSKRMNNLNWDPHFPHTAPVAAQIYKIRTAGKDINGTIDPDGRDVDGVFQIDVTGVAYLLDAMRPIQVDSWAEGPISGNNLERVALIDSYIEFSAGGQDASDSGAARKAFNEDLVEATWRALQEPDDLIRTVFQLSRTLAQRHMQVWVKDKEQQEFFRELGWAGAISSAPGDYLYVVDQNLGDDTLDTFTSERVNYDVTVREDGTLDVRAEVAATNFVDETLPYPIVDIDTEPTKRTYVNLYAPGNAELQKVTFSDRFETFEIDNHLENTEAGRKVFSAKMAVKAHETASLVFEYTVPGGLLDEDGPLYRLTVQRQPRHVDQSLRVTVTFPENWDAKGYDDEVWTVEGNRATAFVEALEQDRTFELRF